MEEQINDLTELHQHEIENIKSGITDMEEKVQYQSEERLLDIKEHLQSLETKVTSMEHQQVQQQYLNIEGLDSTDARAIMMKLLNALITFVFRMRDGMPLWQAVTSSGTHSYHLFLEHILKTRPSKMGI